MTTLAWTIGLAVFVLMGGGILRLQRRRSLSNEEFEREARRPSLMRTGLQEFQGFLEPEKKAAVEAVREEERKTSPTFSGDPPP